MNLKAQPFSDLSFPKLFKDYISEKTAIHDFFDTNPFSDTAISKKIEGLSYKGDRSKFVEILHEFNSPYNPTFETLSNIDKLLNKDSYAIVTGQQLTLYGGPLFTIYKILTAIVMAKHYEKISNINIIPVFWLADEDHDYAEIASLNMLRSDNTVSLSYNSETDSAKRVAEIQFENGFQEFRNELKEHFPETDFHRELWSNLDSFYKEGESVKDAFSKLIMSIFGKYGLVLAGSNSESVKEFTKQSLKTSVLNHAVIYNSLSTTSEKLLAEGYHNQVMVQESNLFWIDDAHNRIKIHYEDEKWFPERTNIEWNTDQLLSLIDKTPNRFSPNVFLRPVLQDHLLPTIAYVAGPGEISYYAQMKAIYREFDLHMPVIIPRFTATIIESGINRIMEKLPFSFSSYSERIEELESRYIDQTDAPDLESLFSSWKNEVDLLTDSMKSKIIEIDPTLEGTAGKASATYYTELDKLKGKLYKSLKQQETTQINRISKIKENLYPNRNLQEREIAFIYYMNKYGLDIWDHLFVLLKEEKPDTHKLIHV